MVPRDRFGPSCPRLQAPGNRLNHACIDGERPTFWAKRPDAGSNLETWSGFAGPGGRASERRPGSPGRLVQPNGLRPAAGAADRRDGQGDVEQPAILRLPHGLEVLDPLSEPQAAQDLALLGEPFGGDERRDRSSHDLLGGVSEHPLRGCVEGLDDPVQVLADDSVVGGLDDGGQVGFARGAARIVRLHNGSPSITVSARFPAALSR